MINLTPSPDSPPADTKDLTVYQRLLGNKRTELTRQAYAYDLATFAQFLNLFKLKEKETYDLTTIPDKSAFWQDLDTAVISAYVEWLKSIVSEHTGRPLASSTIARKITAIKEFLGEAEILGLYDSKRFRYIQTRIEPPEVSYQHHGGITPDEQNRLLQAASEQPGLKGQRDYLIFRLLLETGIRRGELCKLKVRDLSVKESIPVLFIHGKGGRDRGIGIEGDTHQLLKDWLGDSGQGNDPGMPIFSQVRKFGRRDEARYRLVTPDKHLSTRTVNLLVEQYVKLAGIEGKVTPHSFRVAMVTDSLAGGAPIQHVQKVTGHTTVRMITEIYDRNQYSEPVSKFRKHKLFKPDDHSELS